MSDRKITLLWDKIPVATVITNESHLDTDEKVSIQVHPTPAAREVRPRATPGPLFYESTLLEVVIEPVRGNSA